MNGDTQRQRRNGARAFAVVLFATTAALLFRPEASSGYVSCTRDTTNADELNILLAASGDDVKIERTANGSIWVSSDTTTTPTNCGLATVHDISEIHVALAGPDLGAHTVTIDMTNGFFAAFADPNAGSEIKFNIDLGDDATTTDVVEVVGRTFDDQFVLRSTTSGSTTSNGVNLNAAETVDDYDVALTAVDAVRVDGGAGNDRATGMGEAAPGDEFALPITFLAGDGNDEVIGGAAVDTMDYSSRTTSVEVWLDGLPNDGSGAEADNVDVENLKGGTGSDYFQGPADEANAFDGGSENENDEVSYDDRDNPVTVTIGDEIPDGEDGEGDNVTGSIEIVTGGDGDDELKGDGGNDILNGGDGDDKLTGGDGNDTLNGGDGSDELHGEDRDDTLNGGSDPQDSDILVGGAGGDTASYADRTNPVELTLDAVANDGEDGENDSLSEIENLTGGSADDLIVGDGPTNNQLRGGEGNDTIEGGDGDDSLLDGEGGTEDTVTFSLESSVTVDLSENNARNADDENDTLAGFENVVGSPGADTLVGSNVDNVIEGRGGNDRLIGNGGDDELNGGANTDIVDFKEAVNPAGVVVDLDTNLADATVVGRATGDGTDELLDIENAKGSNQDDRLSGTAGANTLYGELGDDILNGRATGDTLNGGEETVTDTPAPGETFGIDSASYADATGPVTVDIGTSANNAGEADDDVLFSIEGAEGSDFDDRLDGDGTANRLSGLGGEDTITGQAGDDILLGGDDDDEIAGGSGSDTIDYSHVVVTLVVDLSATQPNAIGEGTDFFASVENVVGGSNGDRIIGDDNPNVLRGGGGADTLHPGADLDTVVGGSGTDTVDYSKADGPITASLLTGSGGTTGDATDADTYTDPVDPNDVVEIENLTGSPGNDNLTGDDEINELAGLAGTDTVSGQAGSDTLVGGEDDDRLLGDDGNDKLIGEGGGDTLLGGDGEDTADYSTSVVGVTADLRTPDNNTNDADGDTYSNTAVTTPVENLTGSPENDDLQGDGNDNEIKGGGGNDTVSYSGAPDNGVTVDLDARTATGDGNDDLIAIANITGSPQADTLSGDENVNTIDGGGDGDTINGRAGGDTLTGGGGVNTVTYAGATGGVTVDLAAGTATDVGASSDTLSDFVKVIGSSHDDTLRGTTDNNTIDGGGHSTAGDTLSYANPLGVTGGVTVDLALTTAQPTGGSGEDTLLNLQNVTGSAHADTLSGDGGPNTLNGGGEADTLDGRAGSDSLQGEAGNDRLIGGAGGDALIGGDASDTAEYSTATTGIRADFLLPATNTGDAAGDSYTTVENLVGSPKQDTLVGDGNGNTLSGGDEDDTLNGGGGNDIENGGAGQDTFYQGSSLNQADELNGGTGTDLVDYSDRTRRAFVTFDGVANDGEPGEGDNVGTDVEDAELKTTGPGAPTNVRATAGERRATVTWTAPSDDGGSPVTGYKVTSTPDGKTASTGPEARSATVTGLRESVSYTFTVTAVNDNGESAGSAPSNAVTPTAPPPPPPPPPDPATTQGYSLLGSDGAVYSFGNAANAGSIPGLGIKLNQPPIGIAYTPSGNGYWIVAQDGGIFTFGDAGFFGSTGNVKLNAPVLGMEPTPSGQGYWLFAGDGGIFSFGDAVFHGSMGASKLNAPVIGMASTSTGDGYWLVAQDGGIFSFGDATFHGSTGNIRLNQPVFDMAPTPDDTGYWLVARDGGIFSFGSAERKFFGSAANSNPATVIGIGTTPSGNGYWITDRNGVVYSFGDAAALGDLRGLGRTAVGFAAPGT